MVKSIENNSSNIRDNLFLVKNHQINSNNDNNINIIPNQNTPNKITFTPIKIKTPAFKNGIRENVEIKENKDSYIKQTISDSQTSKFKNIIKHSPETIKVKASNFTSRAQGILNNLETSKVASAPKQIQFVTKSVNESVEIIKINSLKNDSPQGGAPVSEYRNKLQIMVNNLSLKYGSNPDFNNALEILKKNFGHMKTSESLLDLLMFSAFAEKMGNEMKNEKPLNPDIFETLENEYIVFFNNLYENVNNNQVLPYNEIKAYLGENTEMAIPLINKAIVNYADNQSRQKQINAQVNSSAQEVKDLIKEGNEQVPANKGIKFIDPTKSELLYILADGTTALEKTKSFSEKDLNEVNNIFGKIIEGKKIHESELIKLRNVASFLLKNSDKLNLNKENFQKLYEYSDGLLVASKNVEQKTDEFKKQVEIVNQKLEKLTEAISDPNLKLNSNFIEMFKITGAKYNEVRNSNDTLSIA